MGWQYWTKGLVALAIAVVGALAVAVGMVEGMGLGDLNTAQWLTVIGVGLAELLAMFSLQKAPASISISTITPSE